MFDFEKEARGHDYLLRIKQIKVKNSWGTTKSTKSILQYKHDNQWWDVPVISDYVYPDEKGYTLGNV